jgi:hypothetical protein
MLAWLAGLVGIAALGRWLAGRSKARPVPTAPAPEPAAVAVDEVAASEDDPAVELRRMLAETRAEPAPEPSDESVDERRARVHAEARATIDAMADDSGDP